MPAVLTQVVPRRVLGGALVHPVRFDQTEERLARERELTDRRLQDAHHRPGRLAVVARFDLPLQLVERGEAIPFDLVAENVH